MVVINKRESTDGKRERIVAYKVLIEAEAGVGSESVRGRPRPAKVAMRMLTVGEVSMLAILHKKCQG